MAADHMHKCYECGREFGCDGALSFNYDGLPETVCDEYHESGRKECPRCAYAVRCEYCGEDLPGFDLPPLARDAHYPEAPTYSGPTGELLCVECAQGDAEAEDGIDRAERYYNVQ